MNSLAAYFFNIEYFDDPNVEISTEEVIQRRNEATIFIEATNELVANLKETEATSEVDVMTIFYDVGKKFFGVEKTELFRFFKLLYMTVWGSTAGPRFGVFAVLYGGAKEFAELIETRLDKSIHWL